MYRFGGSVFWLICKYKNLIVLYDPKEIIQQRYHQKLFAVLIPALEDPEPRCIFLLYHDTCFILIFLKEYMHTPLPLLSTFAKA